MNVIFDHCNSILFKNQCDFNFRKWIHSHTDMNLSPTSKRQSFSVKHNFSKHFILKDIDNWGGISNLLLHVWLCEGGEQNHNMLIKNDNICVSLQIRHNKYTSIWFPQSQNQELPSFYKVWRDNVYATPTVYMWDSLQCSIHRFWLTCYDFVHRPYAWINKFDISIFLYRSPPFSKFWTFSRGGICTKSRSERRLRRAFLEGSFCLSWYRGVYKFHSNLHCIVHK